MAGKKPVRKRSTQARNGKGAPRARRGPVTARQAGEAVAARRRPRDRAGPPAAKELPATAPAPKPASVPPVGARRPGLPPALLALRQRQSFAGVGRNDLCPCGSGKRYKNCHGH